MGHRGVTPAGVRAKPYPDELQPDERVDTKRKVWVRAGVGRACIELALRVNRRRWCARYVVLGFACLTLLATLGEARAASGQWQAGGRLGLAWLDAAGFGPSLEAYLRQGLSDSFDFDLQVLASIHPFQSDSKIPQQFGTSDSDFAWQLTVAPAVIYRWDVLRVVPFIGAGPGLYLGRGSGANRDGTDRETLQFGATARLGVDYLASRNVVLSVQTSTHLVLADGGVRLPWLQVGIGFGHAWGW
jgi:hypothetical protein